LYSKSFVYLMTKFRAKFSIQCFSKSIVFLLSCCVLASSSRRLAATQPPAALFVALNLTIYQQQH
jgi:hypothetical protein